MAPNVTAEPLHGPGLGMAQVLGLMLQASGSIRGCL